MAEKENNYIPTPPGLYQGNQVFINSDRLIFNARVDSILLYSEKAIGFSTNGSFHFDTGPDKDISKFIINSPNIYLGMGHENTLPKQCAVLSDDLILALGDILKAIEKVYADLTFQVSFTTVGIGKKTTFNAKNFTLLLKRQQELGTLLESFQDIKSKNTKLV